MKSGIYKIICTKNSRYYIGSAKNIKRRWNRHLNDLKNNKHVNIHMQRAYNKYGKDSFNIEILEYCNECDILIREQFYLDKMMPYIDNFNIGEKAIGGDNITHHPDRDNIVLKMKNALYNRYENQTEEDKLKRSLNIMGEKNPNFGNKWNNQQRERMSKQRKGLDSKIKGKSFEEIYGEEKAKELKKSISNYAKTRTGEKNSFYGKKHTEENIKFFSETQKNKPNKSYYERLKPFIIDDIEYLTLSEASKKLNINYLTIRNRLLSNNFKNYYYIKDENKIKELKDKYINLESLDS